MESVTVREQERLRDHAGLSRILCLPLDVWTQTQIESFKRTWDPGRRRALKKVRFLGLVHADVSRDTSGLMCVIPGNVPSPILILTEKQAHHFRCLCPRGIDTIRRYEPQRVQYVCSKELHAQAANAGAAHPVPLQSTLLVSPTRDGTSSIHVRFNAEAASPPPEFVDVELANASAFAEYVKRVTVAVSATANELPADAAARKGAAKNQWYSFSSFSHILSVISLAVLPNRSKGVGPFIGIALGLLDTVSDFMFASSIDETLDPVWYALAFLAAGVGGMASLFLIAIRVSDTFARTADTSVFRLLKLCAWATGARVILGREAELEAELVWYNSFFLYIDVNRSKVESALATCALLVQALCENAPILLVWYNHRIDPHTDIQYFAIGTTTVSCVLVFLVSLWELTKAPWSGSSAAETFAQALSMILFTIASYWMSICFAVLADTTRYPTIQVVNWSFLSLSVMALGAFALFAYLCVLRALLWPAVMLLNRYWPSFFSLSWEGNNRIQFVFLTTVALLVWCLVVVWTQQQQLKAWVPLVVLVDLLPPAALALQRTRLSGADQVASTFSVFGLCALLVGWYDTETSDIRTAVAWICWVMLCPMACSGLLLLLQTEQKRLQNGERWYNMKPDASAFVGMCTLSSFVVASWALFASQVPRLGFGAFGVPAVVATSTLVFLTLVAVLACIGWPVMLLASACFDSGSGELVKEASANDHLLARLVLSRELNLPGWWQVSHIQEKYQFLQSEATGKYVGISGRPSALGYEVHDVVNETSGIQPSSWVDIELVRRSAMQPDMMGQLSQECEARRAVSHAEHPHMQRLKEVFISGEGVYIVSTPTIHARTKTLSAVSSMPLPSSTPFEHNCAMLPSLSEYLGDTAAFSIGTIVNVARQIGSALQHMHDCGVVHRAITPSRIRKHPRQVDHRGVSFWAGPEIADRVVELDLFGEETKGRADSVDWILTLSPLLTRFQTPQGDDCLPNDRVGATVYACPEMILGRRYDGKADCWAFGVVLYTMIAGFPPFNGATTAERDSRICRGLDPHDALAFPEPYFVPAITAMVSPLLRGLLCVDPAQRWSAAKVVSYATLEQMEKSLAAADVLRAEVHQLERREAQDVELQAMQRLIDSRIIDGGRVKLFEARTKLRVAIRLLVVLSRFGAALQAAHLKSVAPTGRSISSKRASRTRSQLDSQEDSQKSHLMQRVFAVMSTDTEDRKDMEFARHHAVPPTGNMVLKPQPRRPNRRHLQSVETEDDIQGFQNALAVVSSGQTTPSQLFTIPDVDSTASLPGML